MVVIGKIKGIVMSSRFRTFDSKPQEGKPSRNFKLNEVMFFAPEVNITGLLRDWDLMVPAEEMKAGDTIEVCYNRCQPAKGFDGVYEFSGFPILGKK